MGNEATAAVAAATRAAATAGRRAEERATAGRAVADPLVVHSVAMVCWVDFRRLAAALVAASEASGVAAREAGVARVAAWVVAEKAAAVKAVAARATATEAGVRAAAVMGPAVAATVAE